MKYLNLSANTCVDDNLCGIYSTHIKKINVEYIRQLSKAYFGEDWNYNMGYTSSFILKFCQNHNISMCALT